MNAPPANFGCLLITSSALVMRAVLAMAITAGSCAVTTAAAAEKTTPKTSIAEPSEYRTTNYRAPVPETLTGARVIDVGGAEDLWLKIPTGDSGQPDSVTGGKAIFIDVYPQPPKPPNLPKGTIWRDPTHVSIKGAIWLPNVGYGLLSPTFKQYFEDGLRKLTDGNKERPLVFFCLRDCWMSWNAAKRALEWGYTNVIWFPDGTDSWQDLALPTEKIKPFN